MPRLPKRFAASLFRQPPKALRSSPNTAGGRGIGFKSNQCYLTVDLKQMKEGTMATAASLFKMLSPMDFLQWAWKTTFLP